MHKWHARYETCQKKLTIEIIKESDKVDMMRYMVYCYSHLPNKWAGRNKQAGLYFSQNFINGHGSKSTYSKEIKHCILRIY